MKIRIKIKELEHVQTTQRKSNEIETWHFEKINQITKSRI